MAEQKHVVRTFKFSNIINLETLNPRRDASIPGVKRGRVEQVLGRTLAYIK